MRKTATLVFCDLVGSTQLGEALDGEAMRHLLDRYFNAMRDSIERHGGTVEKFIGDAVVGAFGVPVLHEDDPMRAVRAAAEMRHAVAEISNEVGSLWGIGVSARIGINTGEVIAGDPAEGHSFVSGDAVNIAARLEQNAPTGDILIGESTYRQVRDAVTVTGPLALDVKGKAEPVQAYNLLEVMADATGVSRRLDSTIVGRSSEMARLRDTFESCRATNTPRLTTILGAPGMGKTRLAMGFLETLDEDTLIMSGGCPSYGEGITFLPLARALRRVAGIARSDPAEVASDKLHALLERVSNEASSEIGAGSGVVDRLLPVLDLDAEPVPTNEVFWAVRRLLETLSARRPVVLLLDDVHWAEPTLLDLVEYLFRFVTGAPLLILCLARPTLLDSHPGWAGIADLISLEPLTDTEVGAMLGGLLEGSPLPESFTEQIISVCDGHPLYVEELVQMLIDDGSLVSSGDAWVLADESRELSIPPTIHALVAARLDKLPPDHRSILEAASVIGPMFWMGAVDELRGNAVVGSMGIMHDLVVRDLVVPEASTLPGQDAFAFSHSMVREVTYLSLTKLRRSELHLAFAQWLERWGEVLAGGQEVMANHLERAYLLRREAGSLDQAMADIGQRASGLLAQQGKERFASGDLPAAANYFRRAARILPKDHPDLLDLNASEVTARIETGEVAAAVQAVGSLRAIAIERDDMRSRAVHKLHGLALRSLGDFVAWKRDALGELAELSRVFEDLDDHLSLSQAHQLIAEVHWDNHHNEGTRGSLEVALEHARAANDRYGEGRILSWLATSFFWGPTPVADAMKRCGEIAAYAPDAFLVQARVMQSVAGLEAMNGEFAQARELMERSRRIQRELGQGLNLATSTQFAGLIELLAGDPEAAVGELRSGLRSLSEMGASSYLATQAALLARALYAMDSWDEALHFSDMSREIGKQDKALLAEWGPTRARVLARRGQMNEAERIAAAAAAIAVQGDDVFSTGNSFTALTEVMLELGREKAAASAARVALKTYRAKGITAWVDKLATLVDAITPAPGGLSVEAADQVPSVVVRLDSKSPQTSEDQIQMRWG